MTKRRRGVRKFASLALIVFPLSSGIGLAEPSCLPYRLLSTGGEPKNYAWIAPPVVLADNTKSQAIARITSPIEDATLNPQIYVSPPKDLQLRPENEGKAEAIARYIEGLTLQEAGEP